MLTSCHTMGAAPIPTGSLLQCEAIVDERALQGPFTPMTFEDAKAWVARVFSAEVQDNGREGNLRFLYWTSDGRTWSLHLREDETTLGVLWEIDPPALHEVIRCIGEPEYYNAYYDRGSLSSELGIFYPSRGLSFGARQSGLVERFDPMAAVTRISYYMPGSLENTILAPSAVEPGSELYERLRHSIRPWPGSLDQIVIGDAPY